MCFNDDYECPKCKKVFPKDNKFKHDLNCLKNVQEQAKNEKKIKKKNFKMDTNSQKSQPKNKGKV